MSFPEDHPLGHWDTRVDPRTRILVSAGGSTRVGGPPSAAQERFHAPSVDRVDVPERNPDGRSDCGQALSVAPAPAYRGKVRQNESL